MRIAPFAICLSLLLGCLASIAEAQTLRTVAFSGNQAPGLGSGVNFFSFGTPALNGSGQTAFRGSLSGTGVGYSNDKGIWSEGAGGGLALVAREGNPAPGTPSGVNFSSLLTTPVLNAAGQTAFRASLAGTGVGGSNSTGVWSEGGGGLALVARAGNPAPGTGSGVIFSVFSPFPVLNNDGQTAFQASLTGPGVDYPNNEGVWSEGSGGGLALVARSGNPAPGTLGGVNFAKHFSDPVLNAAGQMAFRGSLVGTGVLGGMNDNGIWSEGANGGLALVAREGNPAPGTPSGIIFSVFNSSPVVLNAAGKTAFSADIRVGGANTAGIWSEGGGGLALIARSGNPAPGTVGGVNFTGFGDPVLNGAGKTAFVGFLSGTGVDSMNSEGIWSEGGGELALVARSGSPAPGTPSGVNFDGFRFPPIFPALNGAGQTAFLGGLTGAGVDFSNDAGIWAEDLSGVLTLIAREGDMLDVDDGPGTDFRTISGLSFAAYTGNEDGRPSGFNDLGQLAFLATFTDGTKGIFVSNLVAVPEPSTLLLGAISALGLLMYKRR